MAAVCVYYANLSTLAAQDNMQKRSVQIPLMACWNMLPLDLSGTATGLIVYAFREWFTSEAGFTALERGTQGCCCLLFFSAQEHFITTGTGCQNVATTQKNTPTFMISFHTFTLSLPSVFVGYWVWSGWDWLFWHQFIIYIFHTKVETDH